MEVDKRHVDKNNLVKSMKLKYDRDPSIETIKEMPDVSKKLKEIIPSR